MSNDLVVPANTDLPARVAGLSRMLEAATTAPAYTQVIALSAAVIAYAKGMGKEYIEAIREAEKIRAIAEMRLGEYLQQLPKNTGGRPASKTPTKVEGVSGTPSTVAELGLDYKTTSRAQKLAALPEETKQAVIEGKIKPSQAIRPVRPEAPKPANPTPAAPPPPPPEKAPKKAKAVDSEEVVALKDEIDNLLETQESLLERLAELELRNKNLEALAAGKGEELIVLKDATIKHLESEVERLKFDNRALIQSRDKLTRLVRKLDPKQPGPLRVAN